MKKVLVIGHWPPPVDGERLCCVYLCKVLEELGWQVKRNKKRQFSNLSSLGTRTWIIVGATRPGFVRDLTWIFYHCRFGDGVFAYIHNQSWRYFESRHRLLRALVGPKLRIVVLTDHIRESLQKVGYDAVVLPNTITDLTLPEYQAPPTVKRLMWMGGTMVEKGFVTAYEAFVELRRTDPEWRMDVYGVGQCYDERDQYEQATFHGLVQQQQKIDAFLQGGIFILPSRYVNETQPLGILEAMCFGLPVVASQQGGISEMIGVGEDRAGRALDTEATGLQYAAEIRQVFEDYQKFSENSRNRYLQKFDKPHFRSRLDELVSGQQNS